MGIIMGTITEINKLTVILINPSRYDDDGYVIRYMKGVLPCNTLTCMRSLTLAFADRWKHDRNIDIDIKMYDEVVETIPFSKISRWNRHGHRVVAAIVGVQSNQFPRASDLAKRLTDLGVKTLIGGFHVSGILALFGDPSPEIQELMDYGVTIVQGEAESRWENILAEVLEDSGKALYRQETYPDISEMTVPSQDDSYLKNFALPNMGTLDCSRGCPFGCTFCTVINVQGRKMRYRTGESVLETIRINQKHGITRYFFTDDNFSRNPEWETIFDGIASLNECDNMGISFMMQIDTRSHTIPNFVDKASRAGCTQVFIGMESLNPKNLAAVKKNQNKVEDYAEFIDSWHRVGVMTHVGYIIGFPYDTVESVRDDIRRLMNEIKVDQASFFMLTPLPGSADHYNNVQNGTLMDPDLSKYDSFHAAMEHPLMTEKEWFQAYDESWEAFYSYDNLKKVLMRAGTKEYWNIFKNIMWYKNSLLEPRHPMVAGFVRRKHRTDVRPGTEIIPPLRFHLNRTRDFLSGFKKRIQLFFELEELWLATRKPDDPTFRYVADFTETLGDMRNRLHTVATREELISMAASLKQKVAVFREAPVRSKKSRRKINSLIGDIQQYLDRVMTSEQFQRGRTQLTSYLHSTTRQFEDFTLKQVARRRRLTRTWTLTWARLKSGKIIQFAISLPKIAVSMIRDFRLSLSFAYHLKNKNF